MSDITISVVQPPSTTINVGVDETLIVGAGISFPSHSVTHISGGSDELNHNLLGGLQGGSVNQYYHISSGQYFNLTTGDVVRPSETGIFYTNDNLSGFITGVDLSAYATINYVGGVSGDIQSQVNNLNNATGSYVLDSETGIFYLASNPSGYITGVDLSSYSTIVYVTGISGSLQDQIIVLNNQTGSYITGSVVRPNETGIFITNSQTGQFYSSNNPSGFITGIDSLVLTTGNQVITGEKIFTNNLILQSSGNQLMLRTGEFGNTIFITTPAIFGNRTYTVPDVGTGCAFVLTAGPQTISGLKDFTIRPTFSGTDVALVSETIDSVYKTGNQAIAGDKVFTNGLTIQTATNQLIFKTGNIGNSVSITAPTISTNRTFTLPDIGTAAAFVVTAGVQTIGGAKNFSSRPTVNTTGVALVSEVVYITGNQNVSGIKIFGQNTSINNSTNSHILGGISNNIISGNYSIIGGGQNNQINEISGISVDYVSIVGGLRNNVFKNYGTIVGGQDNTISGNHSFIGGGRFNTGNGTYSTIIGGDKNLNTSNFSVICGGEINEVSNGYSSILGGKSNRALGTFSCVLGGFNNTNQSSYSVIGGGYFNNTVGNFSVIGGGYSNKHLVTNTPYSFIGGGYNNVNYGEYSVICGGFSNQTSFQNSFVGGGSRNNAGGSHSSVVCGYFNEADNQYACVLNGTDNKILGQGNTTNILNGAGNRATNITYSYIGNGRYNLISGYNYEFNEAIETYFVQYSHILNGEYNSIFRTKSSILNGDNNIISGEGNTIVCGNRSYIEPNHTGAVILADRQDRDHLSKGSDTCSLDFASGVYLRLPSFEGSKDQAGNLGELKVSGEYLYIATGQNTWGRIQISTFN